MLLFDTILIIAVLIALLIASISDLRTREVPDWISYGLIFFVLLTRGLQSVLSKNHTYFTYSFIAFLIFFALSSLLYYTKQWGGGDAKLISGLGAAFAVSPFNNSSQALFPYPAILLINILIAGAIYAMIYAIVLAVKNKKLFLAEFKKINVRKTIHRTKLLILILAVAFAVISFYYFPPELIMTAGLFSVIMILLPYVLVFIKSVESACMYKTISPAKLTEGDWVQNDVYINKRLVYKTQPFGIDKKSIDILRKANIKQVLIKEGIPFIPSFLIGTIITLILGKVIFFPLI